MKELSLHILDILQNSARAKATRIELNIEEDTDENRYIIEITDNGTGMSKEMADSVINPFVTSRTTRKVGLGIPLFKQTADQSGGGLEIESELGKGTKIKAHFLHNNIDRPILGGIASVLVSTVASYPEIDFVYRHTKNGVSYEFDTVEIKDALDGVPIGSPAIMRYLIEMINENLKEIGAY